MKQCPPQLKQFVIGDDKTAERLIDAMAHPVELPEPSPELIKKFEDGKKSIKKFGGVQDDKSDEPT